MQIEDLQAIQDETEQIQALYRIYDEDSRLSCSQAAQVEFLTNTYYIEQYLQPGMRILDVGAGTGAYSILPKRGTRFGLWNYRSGILPSFRKSVRRRTAFV